jgi:hypothetical protein
MKQLQDIELSSDVQTAKKLVALRPNTKDTQKDERNTRTMKRQGRDAKAVDPLALMLKSGVYLDFAFPVLPKDKALKPKVTKIVSQMLPGERILARRRIAIMAKYITAIQSVLTQVNNSQCN